MNLPNIPQDLGNGLTIKSCHTEQDIDLVIGLNAEMHGENEANTIHHWLKKSHPHIVPEGWFFVQDEKTGQAVSTVCLMPLTWQYGPVILPVAEMGFVSTRTAYQKRGLQRTLSSIFDKIALANGYALAAIEGIPYFYRQFGYEYAVPMVDGMSNCWYTLALEEIPAVENSISFRPATQGDVPSMSAFYTRQNRELDITTARPDTMWRYYLDLMESGPPCKTGETSGLRLFIIEHESQTIGYLALMPSGWRNQLNVMELGLAEFKQDRPAPADTIRATLDYVRQRAEFDRHETVGISLARNHPASVLVRHMGIRENQSYGWQMKLLDPVQFLVQITPVLEERLSNSVLKGSNEELNINLYRSRAGLRIKRGRIKVVEIDEQAKMHLSIPPTTATQLMLGWKSLQELDEWTKDLWVVEEKRGLIDILFPVTQAHIYLGY